jgi:hypothetical protein
LGRASRRRFRLLSILSATLVLWNLLLVSQYRYSLVPADAGADPATLFHNAFHLLAQKRFHLLPQVALGPILLALIWWKAPQSDTPTRGASCMSGLPALSETSSGLTGAVVAGSGGAFG